MSNLRHMLVALKTKQTDVKIFFYNLKFNTCNSAVKEFTPDLHKSINDSFCDFLNVKTF